MSIQRTGVNFGGFMGQLPSQSNASPPPTSAMDTAMGTGLGIGAASAASRSFDEKHPVLYTWAAKAGLWGSREAMADVVDRAFNSSYKAVEQSKPKFDLKQALLADEGVVEDFKKTVAQQKVPPKTYSQLLHLGEKTVPVRDLSWEKYKETVRENFKDYGKSLRANTFRNFFHGVTPASYLKETVIQSNVQPVKDLFSDNPDKKIGSGIFRLGAFGLMGWEILHHTHAAYRQARQQEDGSFLSRLNTWKETGLAFAKYAVRSLLTWEAAGVGFAVGRALTVIALGGIPLGGIIVGGLIGALAQYGLDPVLRTGRYDPAAPAQKTAEQSKTSNPFKTQAG